MRSHAARSARNFFRHAVLRVVGAADREIRRLRPPPELPDGADIGALRRMMSSLRIDDAPRDALAAYIDADFERFVRTFALAKIRSGRVLELGANPYFMTIFLREYAPAANLVLANYFAPGLPAEGRNHIIYERRTGETCDTVLGFDHFNLETQPFPYPDETFDTVLFCEIVEHLTVDPLHAMLEIHRVLKPGGTIVVTTPNVARLENIGRLTVGKNIYDPYSAHGPYGRHNREYTADELSRLLRHAGFAVEELYTADVHDNAAFLWVESGAFREVLAERADDLGQYVFSRARRGGAPESRKPAWLYRSYPPEQLT